MWKRKEENHKDTKKYLKSLCPLCLCGFLLFPSAQIEKVGEKNRYGREICHKS
jgi:hypothetical protein